MTDDQQVALRIIDANINRLREGLRVVEEYIRYRPSLQSTEALQQCKQLRHKTGKLSALFDSGHLLLARDIETDPLSEGFSANELVRRSTAHICMASLKRCQEAARVIEEYAKLVIDQQNDLALTKQIRFALYSLEKQVQAHL